MWDPEKSAELYNLAHWADGYFTINEQGNLCAHPRNPPCHAIDLSELAGSLEAYGLSMPALLRFPGILHDRIDRLCTAFAKALDRTGRNAGFTAAYPIKVNQQHSVVTEILSHRSGQIGLEAGSKPELLAALALSGPGQPVICNGYKDREFIRLALLARDIGIDSVIVLEKRSELELVLQEAASLGITPRLGLRTRLATLGAGKWQNSGGERAKFGFYSGQVLQAIDRLKESGLLETLDLLHFHMGSQVANVRDIRIAMTEAARNYAELHRLGAKIRCVDVGGGLGIDYEGTRSRNYFSMNYSLQTYADCVVDAFHHGCELQNLPFPDLITECGRAMTAHHAVLVTHVTDVEYAKCSESLPELPSAAPDPLGDLYRLLASRDTPVSERWYDAQHCIDKIQAFYLQGGINLETRAVAESVYACICQQIKQQLEQRPGGNGEILDTLHLTLADKYFCNLSIFQSLPDIWGIGQVFPIMPLQRLHQKPDRRAILEDLTCDSDGQIEKYVDSEGIDCSLPVHSVDEGESYLFGFFLVGAYQEILGDIHNLFGDTDSANIDIDEYGQVRVSEIRSGDTVRDLLGMVNHAPDEIESLLHNRIESAALDPERREQYRTWLSEGLDGYSYLEK